MPLRKAHIFQVVVLAARAYAFLCRRRPRVLPLFQPKKHVLELVHPRIRKQQSSVPMRHQRGTPHPPEPLALKEAQERLADFVATPGLLFCLCARHVCLSFPKEQMSRRGYLGGPCMTALWQRVRIRANAGGTPLLRSPRFRGGLRQQVRRSSPHLFFGPPSYKRATMKPGYVVGTL